MALVVCLSIVISLAGKASADECDSYRDRAECAAGALTEPMADFDPIPDAPPSTSGCIDESREMAVDTVNELVGNMSDDPHRVPQACESWAGAVIDQYAPWAIQGFLFAGAIIAAAILAVQWGSGNGDPLNSAGCETHLNSAWASPTANGSSAGGDSFAVCGERVDEITATVTITSAADPSVNGQNSDTKTWNTRADSGSARAESASRRICFQVTALGQYTSAEEGGVESEHPCT